MSNFKSNVERLMETKTVKEMDLTNIEDMRNYVKLLDEAHDADNQFNIARCNDIEYMKYWLEKLLNNLSLIFMKLIKMMSSMCQ